MKARCRGRRRRARSAAQREALAIEIDVVLQGDDGGDRRASRAATPHPPASGIRRSRAARGRRRDPGWPFGRAAGPASCRCSGGRPSRSLTSRRSLGGSGSSSIDSLPITGTSAACVLGPAFDQLHVRRVGGHLVERRIDAQPAAADPDLVPGVIEKRAVGIDDAGDDARRQADGARQGGEQHGVLVAIAGAHLEHLQGVGHARQRPLLELVVDPARAAARRRARGSVSSPTTSRAAAATMRG